QNIAETGYQPGKEEIQTSEYDVEFNRNGDYDLLIIGSGGAAFSAAIKASENGAKVAMVERGTVGGTCVNIGCVPSKTMLRAGEINGLSQNHLFNGLQTGAGAVKLAKLIEQKDESVDRKSRGR